MLELLFIRNYPALVQYVGAIFDKVHAASLTWSRPPLLLPVSTALVMWYLLVPKKKKVYWLLMMAMVFSSILVVFKLTDFETKQMVLVHRIPATFAGINRSIISQMSRGASEGSVERKFTGQTRVTTIVGTTLRQTRLVDISHSNTELHTLKTENVNPNIVVDDPLGGALQRIESKQTLTKTSMVVNDRYEEFKVNSSSSSLPQNTSNLSTKDEDNCTFPITKIVFIKSHKTGSTTMASIFQRFGYRNNLLFALPKSGHIFSTKYHFSRKFMVPTPKHLKGTHRSFDILTNHAVYNRGEMDAVVSGAKYIAIVRDPVYQFESAFGYFEWAKGMGISNHTNPFQTFMRDPLFYYTTKKYPWKTASKNGQLYDFGFFPRSYENMSIASLQPKVDKIDNEFDLVLLTEYFDESLILLKQLLCWDYDDIIYLPKGIRKENHRYDISDEVKKQIRRWNAGDVLLYDHLNKTFWERVAAYGPSLESDVAEFKRLRQIATDRCVATDKINTRDRRFIKLSNKNPTDEYCQDLLRYDNSYTSLLKHKLRQTT